MSDFIEGSKHPEMRAAVEGHFGTAKKRSMPGVASGKGYQMGGTDAWNAGSPDPLPDHGGYNYSPKSDIGHTVTQKPFSGKADGLPGNSKKLW